MTPFYKLKSKSPRYLAILTVSLVVSCPVWTSCQDLKSSNPYPSNHAMEGNAMSLRLSSPSFEHEGMIPERYTCDGEDINPTLQIDGVPQGTQSFALIVDDPDAPKGTWDHWILWNLDPSIQEIPEGTKTPQGTLGTNDFKRLEYGGPCPPSGTHRYYFKLYALDQKLNLKEGATKEELETAMHGHVLDEAILMGRYARAKTPATSRN